MNSSGSSSPDTADGAVSGGMKTFFLLVIVFLAFLLFASIRYANVDLTPDTPTSSQGASISEPEVVNIQEESPTYSNQGGFLLPVTGACSNPYIVQDGDYLSRVAEICDTSIAAIRAANPEISNANLIYPGQQILIPVGGAVLTSACSCNWQRQPYHPERERHQQRSSWRRFSGDYSFSPSDSPNQFRYASPGQSFKLSIQYARKYWDWLRKWRL